MKYPQKKEKRNLQIVAIKNKEGDTISYRELGEIFSVSTQRAFYIYKKYKTKK